MDIFPELNDKQLDRFSEFLSNFSLLAVASLVIPNIFGVDKPNPNELILGLMLSGAMLLVSLVLLRSESD